VGGRVKPGQDKKETFFGKRNCPARNGRGFAASTGNRSPAEASLLSNRPASLKGGFSLLYRNEMDVLPHRLQAGFF
jgi:hypothetical protein